MVDEEPHEPVGLTMTRDGDFIVAHVRGVESGEIVYEVSRIHFRFTTDPQEIYDIWFKLMGGVATWIDSCQQEEEKPELPPNVRRIEDYRRNRRCPS